MARDVVINGECLVLTKFGAHVLDRPLGQNNSSSARFELGLSSREIRITPRFVHRDINVDDFGSDIPVEVLNMMADVTIRMELVHYDKDVLDACQIESQGGDASRTTVGSLPPAGLPLGNFVQLLASGCHFISLNLTSPQLNFPWRFRACYLTGPPVEIPIGTERTLAQVNWRAIPYRAPTLGVIVSGFSPFAEVMSSGVPLFDRTLDTA